ncbi:MAG: phosphomannomutase/phosphoglucomutase [Bdellovibrio sp.]|nr:phosphomannomutase/phosphoglucomutase [Bdellovibrio sp.]
MPSSIFREYDIRGIAGRDISAPFAYLVGRACAFKMTQKSPNQKSSSRPRPLFSVGWDCRLTSDEYAEALVKGMIEGGLDVVRLGVCPTPLTYFSVFHLDLDGGIMITGSHNPSDYNGFKICMGKTTIHGAQIQELRVLIEKFNQTLPPAQEKGHVKDYPIIPPYTEHLLKNSKKVRKMKIVIDAGNATASTVAPHLFEKMGAEVTPLFCELDGRFPNHHPDPTVPENLTALVKMVKETKADFGLAFDGDSDRLGVVDNLGRILYGDELMVLFSRSILKDIPGATIISEVKSSHRLYNDIADKGGKPIMWKTGQSLIKSKMKETGAVLAGEMSGHLFFADRYFGYDDAIYAATRVYEILSASDSPLSDLLSDLPKTVSTPEIRVDCDEEKKFALVEETKKRLLAKHKITDIDGVRVDFGDAWGLVRASNTQPVLVLRFEAPSEARLKEVRSIVESALKESAKAIGHPPIETNAPSHGH